MFLLTIITQHHNGYVLTRLRRPLGQDNPAVFTDLAQHTTSNANPDKTAELVQSTSSAFRKLSPASATDSPIHIAIFGSSIGSLSLAVGCLRSNVDFTIYESALRYSAIGAGVSLGPNALRAMALISPELRTLYDTISSGKLSQEKLHVAMEAVYAEPGFGEKRGWTPQPFGASCFKRTTAPPLNRAHGYGTKGARCRVRRRCQVLQWP